MSFLKNTLHPDFTPSPQNYHTKNPDEPWTSSIQNRPPANLSSKELHVVTQENPLTLRLFVIHSLPTLVDVFRLLRPSLGDLVKLRNQLVTSLDCRADAAAVLSSTADSCETEVAQCTRSLQNLSGSHRRLSHWINEVLGEANRRQRRDNTTARSCQKECVTTTGKRARRQPNHRPM